jgi:hypothetical protein
MDYGKLVIGGQADIKLNVIQPKVSSGPKAGDCVLRCFASDTAMADEFNPIPMHDLANLSGV